jgi:tetratricopeptide (TPR) repeat protein
MPGRHRGFAQPIDLQVHIVSEKDRPVPLVVQLELIANSRGTISSQSTDAQGVSHFSLLNAGTFRIRVSGRGIKTAVSDAFTVNRGDGMVTQNIRVQLDVESGTSSANGNNTVAAADYAVPKDAAKAFDKGVGQLRKGQWKDAESSFEAAIAIHPKFDRAYDSLGLAKQNGGDVQGAKVAYETALQLNDHNADAQRNLARILEGQREWPGAAELLLKSLATEPNNAGSLTLLSIAMIEQGRVDDAIAAASRVHGLEHKSYPVAHFVLARAYALKQQNDNAVAEYRLYLKEEPSGPRAEAAKNELAKLQTSR